MWYLVGLWGAPLTEKTKLTSHTQVRSPDSRRTVTVPPPYICVYCPTCSSCKKYVSAHRDLA